ncbi:MAG: GspH/FimT family pseudopilin [Candidatus Omnitrophica bacterium]|nr:GspH/FimT family pseudopilin [Candidatus Omnitrophota bacterium]
MKIYRPAQVAGKLGISKQTLLRYEKQGIFPRSRRNHINSWREYTGEDVKKMRDVLSRGFTIIEAVMIIVIVAIMALVAVPRIASFHVVKLAGAAKKLSTDIQYVQQIAVSRHTSTRVIFSSGNETYAAYEEYPQGNNTWQYLRDPFTQAPLVMDYRNDPQYRGVNISVVNFNSSSILVFDWLGAVSAGGYVNLSYQDNGKTVIVSPNTGKVRVQ